MYSPEYNNSSPTPMIGFRKASPTSLHWTTFLENNNELLQIVHFGDVLHIRINKQHDDRWLSATVCSLARWDPTKLRLRQHFSKLQSAEVEALLPLRDHPHWTPHDDIRVVVRAVDTYQRIKVSTVFSSKMNEQMSTLVSLGKFEVTEELQAVENAPLGGLQSSLRSQGPVCNPSTLVSLIQNYHSYDNPYSVAMMQQCFDVDPFASVLFPTPATPPVSYTELRDAQDQKSAQACVLKGIELSKAQKYEQAVKYYHRALQWSSKAADAHVGLGAVHANTSDFEAALKEFDKALKIDPENKNAKVYKQAIISKMEQLRQEQKEREEQDAAKARMLAAMQGKKQASSSSAVAPKKEYALLNSSDDDLGSDFCTSKKKKRKRKKEKKGKDSKKKSKKKKRKHNKDDSSSSSSESS
eukprot:TRINITY_DN64109_c0_g1_i1.p2 TRINITY_DN64109_c0_g1~~TRINITY_DN64109_c0_g1_i1.p2  ORF type:complete len:412 (-),score=58.11 TRINITY_DN64109_c0_g1_i1:1513-2748(-)